MRIVTSELVLLAAEVSCELLVAREPEAPVVLVEPLPVVPKLPLLLELGEVLLVELGEVLLVELVSLAMPVLVVDEDDGDVLLVEDDGEVLAVLLVSLEDGDVLVEPVPATEPLVLPLSEPDEVELLSWLDEELVLGLVLAVAPLEDGLVEEAVLLELGCVEELDVSVPLVEERDVSVEPYVLPVEVAPGDCVVAAEPLRLPDPLMLPEALPVVLVVVSVEDDGVLVEPVAP